MSNQSEHDSLLEEFERAWQSDQAPSVLQFVNQIIDPSESVLVAFVELDLEYRWRRFSAAPANRETAGVSDPILGHPVPLFPSVWNYIDSPVFSLSNSSTCELVLLEYKLRQRWGDKATVTEVLTANESILGDDMASRVRSTLDPTFVLGALSASEDRPPVQIGPYRILYRIAEGGMGVVYAAEQDQPIRRTIALKVIRSGADSREIIARFEAERQALAMMDHPNIARIFDAGTTDQGTPFFAMEFVDGAAITDYCDAHQLSIYQRLELFIPVCHAVQHAHNKGVIHRDLKPSNILVTDVDGKPTAKVIDFGLAKATDHNLRLTDKTMFTEFGQVVGTVKYMSPEQAEQIEDIDSQTDIYSLGVILYELLTGTTPFSGELLGQNLVKALFVIQDSEILRPSRQLRSSEESTATASTVRQISPSRLRQILEGELDWVVMKSLERDRRRRYETADNFAQDVLRFLDHEPVVARPPSAIYRFRKFVRKNTAAVIAATLTFLGLVVALGVSLSAFDEATNQRNVAQFQTERATNEATRASEESRRATAEAVRASVESERAQASEAAAKFQLANARWEAGRAVDATRLLHEIPIEFRDNFEWRYCNRNFQGSLLTLYGSQSLVRSISLSRDGKRLASADHRRTIRIWDTTTWEQIATLEGHTEPVHDVCFNHDGSRLASCSQDCTVRLWNPDSGENTVMSGHKATVRGVCFHPDGSRVYSASKDGTIRIWDANSGKLLKQINDHSDRVTSVAVNTNGTILASTSWDHTVRLWDATSGAPLRTLNGHSGKVNRARFSPDGSRLVTTSDDDTAIVWDVTTGDLITTLQSHEERVHGVAFSPNGKRIATGDWANVIKIWDADSFEELFDLHGHLDRVSSLEFTPDNLHLISGSLDETIKVWDAVGGGTEVRTRQEDTPAASVAFHPSRPLVAVPGAYGVVKLWNTQTGEVVKLPRHRGAIWALSFSTDGDLLASGCSGHEVRVWDLGEQIELKHLLNGHTAAVQSLAFRPDSRTLVSGSWDKTIKIWDVDAGTLKDTLTDHEDRVESICFGSDGSKFVSASWDCSVRIWDVDRATTIETFEGHDEVVFDACITPNGRHIVSSSKDKTIRIWDIDSGTKVREIPTANYVYSLAVSPDGSRLATGGKGNSIGIVDLGTNEELLALVGHSDYVYAVAFAPDGQSILSASNDGTVRLWRAPSKPESIHLLAPMSQTARYCLSKDGERAYAETNDNQFTWDTQTGKRLRETVPQGVDWWRRQSLNGRWRLVWHKFSLVLVDRQVSASPSERAYRRAVGLIR